MSQPDDVLERFPTIKGIKCPACNLSTLFLGYGNYITCSNLECSNSDYAEAKEALLAEQVEEQMIAYQASLQTDYQADVDEQVREARIEERKKVSDQIRRQRDHYEHDKLFSAEHQDGMSAAAVIVYDADEWED